MSQDERELKHLNFRMYVSIRRELNCLLHFRCKDFIIQCTATVLKRACVLAP